MNTEFSKEEAICLLRLEHRALIHKQRISRAKAKKAVEAIRKAKAEGANNLTFQGEAFAQRIKVQLGRQSRAIHLLKCFLRGTLYKAVEASNKDGTLKPMNLVADYGPLVMDTMKEEDLNVDAFTAWLNSDEVKN